MEFLYTKNCTFIFGTLGSHMAIRFEGIGHGWIGQRPTYHVKDSYLISEGPGGRRYPMSEEDKARVMAEFEDIRYLVPEVRKKILAEHREYLRVQTEARAEFRKIHGYGPK